MIFACPWCSFCMTKREFEAHAKKEHSDRLAAVRIMSEAPPVLVEVRSLRGYAKSRKDIPGQTLFDFAVEQQED